MMTSVGTGERVGLLRVLDREARDRPAELVAVVDGERSISYAELRDRATIVAYALRQRGVAVGDVVVVVSAERDWCDFLAAAYGVYLAGGVLCGVSERSGPAGVAGALAACGEVAAVVATSIQCAGLIQHPRLIHYADLAAEFPVDLVAADPLVWEPPAERTACLVLTSGSTGTPTVVSSSWGNVDFDHARAPRPAGVRRRRFVVVPSIGSAVTQSMLHDSAGGPVFVVSSDANPERIAGLIERFQPEVLGLVPAVAQLLVHHLEQTPSPTASVRLVVSGSAPLPPKLAAALDRAFPAAQVYNSYGLTEGGVLTSEVGVDPPGSVGRASDEVEVEVRDADGRRQPAGAVGELWIREVDKPARELWRMEPSGPERLRADGWVRTGDRAWLDEAGYVYLDGRTDHRVDVGGSLVDLETVEQVLAGHEAVAGAVVVPIEDPVVGHQLVGLCELARTIPEAEVLQYANQQLSGASALHAVQIIDRLPLNVNRKLDRRAAAELVADRADRTDPADRAGVEGLAGKAGGPAGTLENSVLGAWRAALRYEELGLDDDLVALGSHSLLAVEVALALSVALDRRAPIALVLQHRTVRSTASALAAALAAGTLGPRKRISSRRPRQD